MANSSLILLYAFDPLHILKSEATSRKKTSYLKLPKNDKYKTK